MTKENMMLRDLAKDIEVIAANGLANQPDDDEACKLHLMRTLTKIGDMAAEFAGMVEVEMYDIDWDTDGAPVKLPKVVRMMVYPEVIPDGLADLLSNEHGFCVNGLNYRRI